jgi:hypothetical protein
MTFSDQIKERIFFVLLFSVLACLAFWDVLLLKTTFNTGDYFQQFYPWSSFYAENIKNFRLPLWTRYVQSGFPLFAEGQVGMLYPLNILFFFALTFILFFFISFSRVSSCSCIPGRSGLINGVVFLPRPSFVSAAFTRGVSLIHRP